MDAVFQHRLKTRPRLKSLATKMVKKIEKLLSRVELEWLH